MTFNYVNYETVNELGCRFYLTPAGPLPSITTVLGKTEPEEKRLSLQRWRESLGAELADQKSREATERGTLVHLLVERYLKGEDVFAPIDGQEVPAVGRSAFNCLKMGLLKKITEVWGQEESLYSPSLLIAGRFDCIGVYDGVPSVIDFKTAGRVKSEADISEYKLQLSFYATAHNELFGTSIRQGVVVMAADVGMPLQFKIELNDELLHEVKIRSQLFWSQLNEAVLSAA